jgi:Spy/CpxP family protein refolding chaperone
MNSPAPTKQPTTRRRWLAGVTIGGLLAGLTAWGVHAVAPRDGHFCRAGWHGRHGGDGFFGGPEAMTQRLNHRVERLFTKAGASAEQKVKAQEILRVLGDDLKPYSDTKHEMRASVREILTAATIDRTRLEQQRSKLVADMQVVSERVTRAMADLAEVLTPEQRRTVADAIRSRHEKS